MKDMIKYNTAGMIGLGFKRTLKLCCKLIDK